MIAAVDDGSASMFANKIADNEGPGFRSGYHETCLFVVSEMAVHFLDLRGHCSTAAQVVGEEGHNYRYTRCFEVDS